jgi:ribonucleotide reductase beta subunit family protein with ferritin-like domain
VTTVSLHDPQTLYRHWEEQQWSPFAIDLVADAEQWQTMGGEERDLVLWALSSLMVARSRERLSPAFAKIFDEALVQAHERLVRNPADPRPRSPSSRRITWSSRPPSG